MRAGEYNRRITFQQKTISYDGYNQQIESWADAFTTWAAITTTGGKELYAAQKVYAETSALFKIRFTRRVTVEMRIKYGNKTYEILHVNDESASHIDLYISAKEVV